MSVHRPVTLKVPSKVPANFCSQAWKTNPEQSSPLLAFASGPGFETKPLELDLRNLPNVDSPDLDNSLRDILLENMKIGNAVSEENEDTVSEVSTCSSAVALQTVDEDQSSNMTLATSQRMKLRTTSFTAGLTTGNNDGSNYLSSSEPEEEDGKKGGIKKSKKISDLFSFNTPSSAGIGAAIDEGEEPKLPFERKRRLSLTKRIFTGSPSTSTSKQEMVNDKDTKKNTAPKTTRKLSLTMFHKPSGEKETRKRTNTDPQLPPKAQHSTSAEDVEKKGEEEATMGHSDPQTKFVPEKAFFKEQDLKIHGLIQQVLRAHLLSMTDYKRETCDRVCKSVCNILKTLVASIKEAEHVQCKIVCQAYIGAIREEGIFASTQALWDGHKDNFAAASYRHDSLFGIACVLTNQLC